MASSLENKTKEDEAYKKPIENLVMFTAKGIYFNVKGALYKIKGNTVRKVGYAPK